MKKRIAILKVPPHAKNEAYGAEDSPDENLNNGLQQTIKSQPILSRIVFAPRGAPMPPARGFYLKAVAARAA